MHMVAFCHPAFSVVTLYYIWHIYRQTWLQRERVLRERVTYMLWVMANRVT